MISVIDSDAVFHAARDMNRRDVWRIEIENGIRKREEVNTAILEANDDAFWARVVGLGALKGTNGENLKVGGSFYSWGPYPRNRRILADIALAAGWSVEKVRELESRCVRRMANHFLGFAEFRSRQEGLANPVQPMHNGAPFTFQHISWGFLTQYVMLELKEMDKDKMAAVKAAVLDRYQPNSQTGKKILPVYDKDTKRISDDLPVSEDEIKQAQDVLDRKARYAESVRMKFEDKKYLPPDQVKWRIKAYIVTHNISEAKFCKEIDVTEDELTAFMTERKKHPMEESRVFHSAHAFMNKEKADDGPPRKRQKQATVEISDDDNDEERNSDGVEEEDNDKDEEEGSNEDEEEDSNGDEEEDSNRRS